MFVLFAILITCGFVTAHEILLLPQLYNHNKILVLTTDCYLQKDYCLGNCSRFYTENIEEDNLIHKLIQNGTKTFVVKQEEYGIDDGFQINKAVVINTNESSYRLILPKKMEIPTLITVNLSRNGVKCEFIQTTLNLTDCLECTQNKLRDVQVMDDVNISNNPYKSSKQLQLIEQSTIPNKIRFPEREVQLQNSSVSSRQTVSTRRGRMNLPALIIETNINSQLRINPGQSPKIVFDVMSNMDKAAYITFSCKDERGILRDLIPRWSWIMPGQVIQVSVLTTLGGSNPSNTASNFVDTITLIALGNGVSKTEKSAMLQVSSFKNQDTTRPYLTYQFTTSCATVRTSICESEIWTVEIRAQDKDSGILQVGSNPVGLNFPTSYVSGTKELITGHYSASCCEPYLEIYAIDANNNRVSYKLDANYLYLSDASIAAVVLGVILLIILIVIIALVVRNKYYQKDSLDLPTYRGNRI